MGFVIQHLSPMESRDLSSVAETMTERRAEEEEEEEEQEMGD